MAQTQLSFLVAAPTDDITSFLDQQHASILDSYALLDSQRAQVLICCLSILVSEDLLQIYLRILDGWLAEYDLIEVEWFSTLAIIIPAPRVHFAFAVDDHSVGLPSRNIHNGCIIVRALCHRLEPLSRPRMCVDFAQVNQNTQIDYPCKETDFLDRIWSESLQQAHLLSLVSVDQVAVKLGVLHCLHILDDLELLGQIVVQPNFDLVSSRHISSVGLLQDNHVLPYHQEYPSRPFHFH